MVNLNNKTEKIFVSVQNSDYDISKEMKKINQFSENIGSIVTFNGIVRELTKKEKLKHLYIEHYPQMTENYIYEIAYKTFKEWNLNYLRIIHRIGILLPKENIVLVAVSSSHREDSFQACQNIMDYLKSSVPMWKKEVFGKKQYWLEPNKKDIKKIERY